MPDTFGDIAEAAFDALDTDSDPDADEAVEVEDEAAEETDPPAAEVDESTEDDEPDAEGDDEDEEGEGDTEEDETDPLAVSDDTVLALPDGSKTTVKDALLRHADYTRKTQELSERREEVEGLYSRVSEWHEERSANPVGWIGEIVTGQDDPTTTLAQAIVDLAKSGQLDPEFVKTFGLENGSVADKAHTSQVDQRIDKLEGEREQERQQAGEAQRREQALSEYRSQYAEIVSGDGLTFDGAEAEREFKAELAQFASDNRIEDLRVAYDAMSRRTERQRQLAAEQQTKRQASEAVARRKKKSGAITAKGSAGRGGAAAKPATFNEAAEAAFDRLESEGALA